MCSHRVKFPPQPACSSPVHLTPTVKRPLRAPYQTASYELSTETAADVLEELQGDAVQEDGAAAGPDAIAGACVNDRHGSTSCAHRQRGSETYWTGADDHDVPFDHVTPHPPHENTSTRCAPARVPTSCTRADCRCLRTSRAPLASRQRCAAECRDVRDRRPTIRGRARR